MDRSLDCYPALLERVFTAHLTSMGGPVALIDDGGSKVLVCPPSPQCLFERWLTGRSYVMMATEHRGMKETGLMYADE